MMNVPFVDLKIQSKSFKREIDATSQSVIDNEAFIAIILNGVDLFEQYGFFMPISIIITPSRNDVSI